MMKIITKQSLIASTASRWKEQYNRNGKWEGYHGDAESIYNRLALLPADATEQMVSDIIGNESWTHLKCDECNQKRDMVILIGELPDYESRTAYICKFCIEKAQGLFMSITMNKAIMGE